MRMHSTEWKMKYIGFAISICALLEVAHSLRDCPALSLNFESYGVKCKPSYTVQTAEELAEVWKKLKCKGWGKWSMPRHRGCSSPTPLPDGIELEKPCGCNFGASCIVKCKPGYEMYGKNIIHCLPTGYYSQLPDCMRVKCGVPSLSSNVGTVGTCYFRENFTCKLECKKPGYKIVGNDYIKCYKRGWSEFPTCQVPCQMDEVPPSLTIIGNCIGKINETCSIKCKNSKLALRGPSNIKCLIYGQWSIFPTCGCPLDTIPPNVLISKSCLNVANSSCRARCAPEYVKDGDINNINCNSDGMWDMNVSIKCLRLCLKPQLPFTLELVGNCSMIEGEECRANCTDDLMDLVTVPTFRCLPNGRYSDFPICSVRGYCPGYAFPASLEVLGTCRYTVGEVCFVRCRDDLALVGPNNISCDFNRNWSPIPKCVSNCREPQREEHVSIDCESTLEGGKCIMQCNSGYEPSKPITITCLRSGKWSKIPDCVRTCAPPILPDSILAVDECSRLVESICKLVCKEPRYKALPSDTIKCLPSGKWSAVPKCRKECDSPQFPHYSMVLDGECLFVVGNKCRIKCRDSSQVLIGSGYIECTESGQQLGDNECYDPCGTPRLPDGVEVADECFVSLPTATCNIKCENPFSTIIGPHAIKCEFGIWSITTTCEVICPPPILSQGTHIVGSCDNKDNSKCRVVCDDPNEKMNDKEEVYIICQFARWTKAPKCEKHCKPLVLPADLQVHEPCRTKNGSRCRVICKDSSVLLHGNPTFICNVTKWSGVTPSCAKLCGTPMFPSQLSFDGQCSMEVYEKCKIKCPENHVPIDRSYITCLQTLTWSQFPRCAKKCVLNNSFYLTNCSLLPGTRCLIRCAREGYTFYMDGRHSENRYVNCSLNGDWIGEFTCWPMKFCTPPPGTEFRGSCDLDDYCTIVCKDDFEYIEGSNEVFCHDDGSVTNYSKCAVAIFIPCNASEFPPLLRIIDDPPYMALTSVTTMCESDYELVGSADIMCEMWGKWGTLPECLRKCSLAEFAGSDEFSPVPSDCRPYAGYYCLLRCLKEDTYLIGGLGPKCNDDGTWSDMPRCVTNPNGGEDCPIPDVKKTWLELTQYNENVYMAECNHKFLTLVGPAGALCQADNTWTTMPKCVFKPVVDCKKPLFPIGSRAVACKKRNVYPAGSKCTFAARCPFNEEEIVVTIYCMSFGDWLKWSCDIEKQKQTP